MLLYTVIVDQLRAALEVLVKRVDSIEGEVKGIKKSPAPAAAPKTKVPLIVRVSKWFFLMHNIVINPPLRMRRAGYGSR